MKNISISQNIVGYAECLPGKKIRCKACQRRCLLEKDQLGFCKVRANQDGKLVLLSYGRVAALHLANVERKPLFHFYPGRLLLSIGGLGCNFRCPGCQNWDLAHADVPEQLNNREYISPAELVGYALKQHLLGISFTYNEPAIWFKYTLDTFRLAKAKKLMTNYVTNGSLTPEALDEIGPYLDAYRVDIKGFSAKMYRSVANFPNYRGILAVTERAKNKWGMHVECVTNIIPTMNDSRNELAALARWIASSLGPDTPWHITRFAPHGKLINLPSTPVNTLEQAREIGLEKGLRFVYLGNVPGHPGENTSCPDCAHVVIERTGFGLPEVFLQKGGICPGCGYQLPGRFE